MLRKNFAVPSSVQCNAIAFVIFGLCTFVRICFGFIYIHTRVNWILCEFNHSYHVLTRTTFHFVFILCVCVFFSLIRRHGKDVTLKIGALKWMIDRNAIVKANNIEWKMFRWIAAGIDFEYTFTRYFWTLKNPIHTIAHFIALIVL